MQASHSGSLRWFLAALAGLACAAASVLLSFRLDSQAKSNAPFKPPAATSVRMPSASSKPRAWKPADMTSIGAATTKRYANIRVRPGGQWPVLTAVRKGIVLPIDAGYKGRWARVFTPCELTGWIPTKHLILHRKAPSSHRGLGDATIVLDAGHGGVQPGAVGRNGLKEKDVNLDIVRRLTKQLHGTRVFLTRDADITAGLRYRARIASSLNAHAFISVHNNAVADGPSKVPGTETYHQVRSSPSRTLAHMLWRDLFSSLRTYRVAWVSDTKSGVKGRANGHGADFYALLRGSRVPAVIVETMFISNPAEEQLLRAPQTRERVAGTMAKTIKTYMTRSKGRPIEPYPAPAQPDTTGGIRAGCRDPR